MLSGWPSKPDSKSAANRLIYLTIPAAPPPGNACGTSAASTQVKIALFSIWDYGKRNALFLLGFIWELHSVLVLKARLKFSSGHKVCPWANINRYHSCHSLVWFPQTVSPADAGCGSRGWIALSLLHVCSVHTGPEWLFFLQDFLCASLSSCPEGCTPSTFLLSPSSFPGVFL